MPSIHVALFIGSLRKASINRRLARALQRLAPPELDFHEVAIDDLPPYNQDFDDHYPPACRRLKDALDRADALLFVTPEYNRSVPGVLKNALDIGSRPWGKSGFAGKPAAVAGASVGAIGSALAQQHLRNVLSYLDVAVLPQPELYLHFKADGLIDDAGHVSPGDTEEFLRGFMRRYADWVRRHLGGRDA